MILETSEGKLEIEMVQFGMGEEQRCMVIDSPRRMALDMIPNLVIEGFRPMIKTTLNELPLGVTDAIIPALRAGNWDFLRYGNPIVVFYVPNGKTFLNSPNIIK